MESATATKDVNTKKDISLSKKDKSNHHALDRPKNSSLKKILKNIKNNGDIPSVENIGTEFYGMGAIERNSGFIDLQRSHGNQYVQKVAGIQAKLKVSQPGDIYEQEADRVAEQVMRMHEPKIQRKCPGDKNCLPKLEEEKKKGLVQLKTNGSAKGEISAPNNLISNLGPGQPLDSQTRAFMEPRFGHDFSDVRVHTDSRAAESAQNLNAKAYTAGNNIFFGSGKYAPDSSEGKHLLAHELTHTIQQTNINSHLSLISMKSSSLDFYLQKSSKEGLNLQQTPQVSEEQHKKIESIIKNFTTIKPNQLQQIKTDVGEIKNILMEYRISDSDEKKMLQKFDYWNLNDQMKNEELEKLIQNKVIPEWPPKVSRTMYLDKLIDECFMRSFWKGTFTTAGVQQYTNVYDDLFRELEDDNLVKFKSYLQKSKSGKDLAKRQVSEFPSFWKEVALKTVVALPGGITAGVGGALQSLPFEFTEKAGEALKGQAKEYLKVVNYGDEKMIESAVGGSALVGEVTASIAQIGRGGPLALANKINQVITIIKALNSAEEYLALKDPLKIFLEFESYSKEVESWFSKPEKIIAVALGLEKNKILTSLENWAEKIPTAKSSKQVSTSQSGITVIINKLKLVSNKIRNILRPIFEVRSVITNLMEIVETAVGQMSYIEDLINISKDPKQMTTVAFQKLLTKTSKELATTIQKEMTEIRQSFKMIIETFSSSDLITDQEVANAVMMFAFKAIPQKYQSIVAVVKDRPEIKKAIADHLIKPLIPQGALDNVNGKLKNITELSKPAIEKAEIGFDSIIKGIDKSLIPVLESNIKTAFIQRSTAKNYATLNIPENQLHELIKQSSGEKISDNIRKPIENGMNYNLNHVRLHQDVPAQQASEILHANAFTMGQNVFFGKNKYNPNSPASHRLLIHELTHIAQQDRGLQRGIIQRDFNELKGKLAKEIGTHVLKGLKFKKIKDPKKEKRAVQIREEVTKLLDKPVISKNKPILPEAYYYTTDKKTNKINGIKRKTEWKNYVPALIINKNTSKIGLHGFEKLLKVMNVGEGKDVTDEAKSGKRIKPNNEYWIETPNWKKWTTEKGGSIILYSDAGPIKLIAKDGTEVIYDKKGDPDFSQYLHHEKKAQRAELDEGFAVPVSRTKDFRRANKKVGHEEWGERSPDGFTWHHLRDGKTLVLVIRKIHRMFTHRGGIAELE